MKRSLGIGVFAASLAAGCSCGGTGGNTGDPDGGNESLCGALGIRSVTVTPATSDVLLDGTTPAPIPFGVTVTYADGRTESLAASAFVWSATRADDTDPGTITADGVFSPNPDSGGTVTVTATRDCVNGTATVNASIDLTVNPPGNPADWTGPVVPGDLTNPAPEFVYPNTDTIFPRNVYKTLFQWWSEGYTEFRLIFTGMFGTVEIHTDGAHPLCASSAPPAGCYESPQREWLLIAGTHAGYTVDVVVDALDRTTMPPTVRRSQAITIGFSRRDVQGAIFYWSTTSAGVRRASISERAPEPYVVARPTGTTYTAPPVTTEINCVACHVVSRDGRYMAAATQAAGLTNSLWIWEVTLAAPPTPTVWSIPGTGGHGYATFSHDDLYVVTSFGGVLEQRDRATGNLLATLDLAATPGAEGTQPDWSPDGTQLAYATGRGDAPGGASIAAIPHNGGTAWGTPQVIVPEDGSTMLFPNFSPNGEWIAYTRGRGGHDDVRAQLHLVRGDGGGLPIEMVRANREVNNVVTDGQHQNQAPTWAPPGDYQWVAFNSMRPYGVVLGAGTQQIWVTAVDLSRAATDQDPSYPAFRLSFQDLLENNHRAYWALDVRDLPDAGVAEVPDVPYDGPCIATGATCDPASRTPCCTPGDLCDTADNGVTYTCGQIIR